MIGSKTIVSDVPLFSTVQGSFPVIDSEGNIYVFYEFFDPNIPNDSNRSIRLVKSTNGGGDFNTNNPIIVASPVTAAATSFEHCDGSTSILVEEIPQPFPLPTLRRSIRTNEFPHAAVATDGTLYVVWNDGKNLATTGIDIYLAFSTRYVSYTNLHIRFQIKTKAGFIFPITFYMDISIHSYNYFLCYR